MPAGGGATPEIVVFGQSGGGPMSPGMGGAYSVFSPQVGGFDFGGGIIDILQPNMPSFSPSGGQEQRGPIRDWIAARRRGETPLRDRWQDPAERRKILRTGGMGLLSLLSPQFRMARNIYKFGKGLKKNPQGMLGGFLRNMLMRKLGPNADLFRAGVGLARGAPRGDVFKNLFVGRGLKAGIGQLAPSLFKKAYQEQGMRGVYMMRQLLSTVMPMAQKGITGKLGGGG